jgi:hypothetical protein
MRERRQRELKLEDTIQGLRCLNFERTMRTHGTSPTFTAFRYAYGMSRTACMDMGSSFRQLQRLGRDERRMEHENEGFFRIINAFSIFLFKETSV